MKLDDMVKSIPSWLQALITVGGLVFSVGVLYADVQGIKRDNEGSNAVLNKHSELLSQIGVIDSKLQTQDKTNERLIYSMDKLSTAAETLSVNVARLEERTRDKTKSR